MKGSSRPRARSNSSAAVRREAVVLWPTYSGTWIGKDEFIRQALENRRRLWTRSRLKWILTTAG